MHLEVLDHKNKDIFRALDAFENFYLAGGTALALHIGHRKSVDFDMFSPDPIPRSLLQKAEGVFLKYAVRPIAHSSDELTVLADDVKVSFIYYPFPVLMDLVAYDTIKLLSIQELAATKAYTIGRRGSLKDYIDVYFLLKERHTTLEKMIAVAEKKYDTAFNDRLFLEQLLFMDDIEDEPIVFLRDTPSREEIGTFLTEAVKTFPLA